MQQMLSMLSKKIDRSNNAKLVATRDERRHASLYSVLHLKRCSELECILDSMMNGLQDFSKLKVNSIRNAGRITGFIFGLAYSAFVPDHPVIVVTWRCSVCFSSFMEGIGPNNFVIALYSGFMRNLIDYGLLQTPDQRL
jgi:hypothetical protein